MNLTIRVFAISSGLNTEPRYLARGYSDSGQLVIESVSHRDRVAGVNEIGEWCHANRSDWRLALTDGAL